MISTLFAEALIKASDIGVPATKASSVKGVLNTVYFWAGALAVIYIVVAAYRFVVSNGDSGQVAQARKGILGAIVGLVVIFSAFLITNFVISGL